MPGEFYHGVGGLEVTLAGFARLIPALDRRPEAHSAVAAWRLRNIVSGGFFVTFAGFGTVALYAVTAENLPLTIRLASRGVVLYQLASSASRHGLDLPGQMRARLTARIGGGVCSLSSRWQTSRTVASGSCKYSS